MGCYTAPGALLWAAMQLQDPLWVCCGLPDSSTRHLCCAMQLQVAAEGCHTAQGVSCELPHGSGRCCAAPCGCSWPLEGAGELPSSAKAALQHPAAQSPWQEHLGAQAATAAWTLPATCPPMSLHTSWQRLHLAMACGLAWLSAPLSVACPPPANTSCQSLHLAPDLPRCLSPADQHLPTSCRPLRLTHTFRPAGLPQGLQPPLCR